VIELRNNPLRRVESSDHAHCEFYESYIAALINEIETVRARIIEAQIDRTKVQAQKVVSIAEKPDAENHCVFVATRRPENLRAAFDLLTNAFDEYFKQSDDEDFSSCMAAARGALVKAQQEAIDFKEKHPPREFHKVFEDVLEKKQFRRMAETYHRVSQPLHPELGRSSSPMTRADAWRLLRDIRRSIYALELLDLDDKRKVELCHQVQVNHRLATVKDLLKEAEGLDNKDKEQLTQLLEQLRKGKLETEDKQADLVAILKKVSGRVGEKIWEVARPVLSDVLTAAVKQQCGL
jgi:hypothetical protein